MSDDSDSPKKYYILHEFGIGYFMTNIVFVAAVMVLLGDFKWKKKGNCLRFIGQFLVCWLWTVLFDTVYVWFRKYGSNHDGCFSVLLYNYIQ